MDVLKRKVPNLNNFSKTCSYLIPRMENIMLRYQDMSGFMLYLDVLALDVATSFLSSDDVVTTYRQFVTPLAPTLVRFNYSAKSL